MTKRKINYPEYSKCYIANKSIGGIMDEAYAITDYNSRKADKIKEKFLKCKEIEDNYLSTYESKNIKISRKAKKQYQKDLVKYYGVPFITLYLQKQWYHILIKGIKEKKDKYKEDTLITHRFIVKIKDKQKYIRYIN